MNPDGKPETLEEALAADGGLEEMIEDSVVLDELGEINQDEQSIISPEEL